jgi:hypothetical protein
MNSLYWQLDGFLALILLLDGILIGILVDRVRTGAL